MEKLFTADDLAAMQRLRMAFNPDGRLSPCKLLPSAGGCGMEQSANGSAAIQQKHPGRRAAL
jgi:glycolate oxidase